MEKTLQEALAKIINIATDGTEKAVEFISGEIPQVIEQLLMWKMAKSMIYFSIGILFFVAAYTTYKITDAVIKDYMENGRPIYSSEKKPSDMDGTCFIRVAGPIVFSIIGFIILVANIQWIQIIIAPKIFLIEYAAGLVK